MPRRHSPKRQRRSASSWSRVFVGAAVLLAGLLALQWSAAWIDEPTADRFEQVREIDIDGGSWDWVGRSRSVWRSDRWAHEGPRHLFFHYGSNPPEMWRDEPSDDLSRGDRWERDALTRVRPNAFVHTRWLIRRREVGWPWPIFASELEAHHLQWMTVPIWRAGSAPATPTTTARAGRLVGSVATPAGASAPGLLLPAPIVSAGAVGSLVVQGGACVIGAWAVSAAWRRRRSRRWRRLGRCGGCGYDLAGLAPVDRGERVSCPECGAEVGPGDDARVARGERRLWRGVAVALAGAAVAAAQAVVFPGWWTLRQAGVVGAFADVERREGVVRHDDTERPFRLEMHWSMDAVVWERAIDRVRYDRSRQYAESFDAWMEELVAESRAVTRAEFDRWFSGLPDPPGSQEVAWADGSSGGEGGAGGDPIGWSAEARAPVNMHEYDSYTDWRSACLGPALELRVGWPWRFASGAAHRGTWEGRGGAVAPGRASTAAVLHAPAGRAEPAEVWAAPMRWEWGAFAANAAVFAAGMGTAMLGASFAGRVVHAVRRRRLRAG